VDTGENIMESTVRYVRRYDSNQLSKTFETQLFGKRVNQSCVGLHICNEIINKHIHIYILNYYNLKINI
jgi:hypothetical protein